METCRAGRVGTGRGVCGKLRAVGTLERKVTLADLRRAGRGGVGPMAMLTCYDFTTAAQMRAAGVPLVLVGDSAANVMLGHATTLPITREQLIDMTVAVRRGHPECFLVTDMPFGSYQDSTARGVRNVCDTAAKSGCDAVKLEVASPHLGVIHRAAAAGVAVIAHLGLRPQSVGVLGGYRTQGRTEAEAGALVELAVACERAGAVAVLLEAVPSETARRVVEAVRVPVIGCGAGPACHGHVVVTQDLLGLTPHPHRPKFVPELAVAPTSSPAELLQAYFREWVNAIETRQYPEPRHEYAMAKAPVTV